MTSVIIPQKSILDLIDEELYTVPNSPILNHSSPVYNPLIFGANIFANSLGSSNQLPSNLALFAETPEVSVSPTSITPESITSGPTPLESIANETPSLFDFASLNHPQNRQKIFNDYGNPDQSFIQPNQLLKNKSIIPKQGNQEPNRGKGKTMKIKTLLPPPSEKFDELFDPNTKPSSSINFDFQNDNDSIFIHHNSSNNIITEAKKEDEVTSILDFDDYNYELDELDDMSDYESDDDNLFDYHDENDTYNNSLISDGYNYNSFDEQGVNIKLEDVNDNIGLVKSDYEDDRMDIDEEDVNPVSKVSPAPDSITDLPTERKQQKKKYDEAADHHCDLINPNTGVPCNKQFSRPYDLIRHQETIHASKKKIFRCVICEGRLNGGKGNGKSKTFSRGDALSRHIKVKHQLVGKEALDIINTAKKNVEFVSVA